MAEDILLVYTRNRSLLYYDMQRVHVLDITGAMADEES